MTTTDVVTSTNVARTNIEAFSTGDWKALAATFLLRRACMKGADRGWRDAFPDAEGDIERARIPEPTGNLPTEAIPIQAPEHALAKMGSRVRVGPARALRPSACQRGCSQSDPHARIYAPGW